MNITFTVTDRMTPDLVSRLQKLRNKKPLMRAAGEAAATVIKEHYLGLPPNSMGFSSVGFWKKEGADKTAVAEFDDSSATVRVSSFKMAHKFFGGHVTPKRAKSLAIPKTDEAYHAGSPSLFLRPLVRKGNALFDETNVLQYILVKAVTHKEDPRAFVPDGRVGPKVAEIIKQHFDAILKAGK